MRSQADPVVDSRSESQGVRHAWPISGGVYDPEPKSQPGPLVAHGKASLPTADHEHIQRRAGAGW